MCMFGGRTFVPLSWLCKKQTSVSHSLTEAEVISLDACLRMDGIPALDLWDLVIEVFHSSSNQTNKTKDVRVPRWNLSANIRPNMRKQIPTNHTDEYLTNIDHLPSNGTHSGSNAMLYVFEDNEAVMKMVIKGRSPTMRHVFLTHRLALDWLFDRINLDSKIQIRYSDHKHQQADVLTKGKFTRDEWNNLLKLINISHFSSTCWAKNSSLISCAKTMARRMKEQKGEERSVAKSKSSAMNLASHVPTSSSSAKCPIASKGPGILTATGKPESRMRRNSKSDAASSSQVRLQDAYRGGLMEAATGKLAAMFSSRNVEPGNQFKNSIFKNASPSNLGRSLLEGNKDHLLSQARSELMRQEHQVGSLNHCISDLQQHAYAQRLELRNAQHGKIESQREQVRLPEESSMKEKVLRDTQLRSMHELREMRRA